MEKVKIHPKLKPFFDKAKKKGWKQGQHLFNFLDETDMMRYDNIKEELVREDCEKEIKDLRKWLSDKQDRVDELERLLLLSGTTKKESEKMKCELAGRCLHYNKGECNKRLNQYTTCAHYTRAYLKKKFGRSK